MNQVPRMTCDNQGHWVIPLISYEFSLQLPAYGIIVTERSQSQTICGIWEANKKYQAGCEYWFLNLHSNEGEIPAFTEQGLY